ncbi:MAG: hypothetical protein AB7F43_07830 [Bacteriovoracia bacterium]
MPLYGAGATAASGVGFVNTIYVTDSQGIPYDHFNPDAAQYPYLRTPSEQVAAQGMPQIF